MKIRKKRGSLVEVLGRYSRTFIEKWTLMELNLVRGVGICHTVVAEWAFQSEGIAGTRQTEGIDNTAHQIF